MRRGIPSSPLFSSQSPLTCAGDSCFDGLPVFKIDRTLDPGGNSDWIIAAAPNGRWQWNINGDPGARVDYDGPAEQISDDPIHPFKNLELPAGTKHQYFRIHLP
ncbi:MAG: hypothetical protein OSB05_15615 [Akkermansiaceae bacterium]|nr:hypothetical protein [Akkermansiaceae bacterium]